MTKTESGGGAAAAAAAAASASLSGSASDRVAAAADVSSLSQPHSASSGGGDASVRGGTRTAVSGQFAVFFPLQNEQQQQSGAGGASSAALLAAQRSWPPPSTSDAAAAAAALLVPHHPFFARSLPAEATIIIPAIDATKPPSPPLGFLPEPMAMEEHPPPVLQPRGASPFPAAASAAGGGLFIFSPRSSNSGGTFSGYGFSPGSAPPPAPSHPPISHDRVATDAPSLVRLESSPLFSLSQPQ